MSLLDRYLGGDREQVWAELRALGPIERGHTQYDDARAVAAETMRRVRGNVEVVRVRLIDAGYQLVAQDRVHVRPAADAGAQLDAFERKHGPLPLSLRAFYEFVGTVNFMQSADQLVQWHKREVAPEPVPELRYAGEYDPLVIGPLDHESAEWDHGQGRHAWYLAPDECHKANYSGGMNYHVLLPDNGADFRIYGMICNEVDQFGDWFVDYLRETFRGGGFRGGIAMDDDEVVGRELSDLAFTRRLAVGLQEIGDERRNVVGDHRTDMPVAVVPRPTAALSLDGEAITRSAPASSGANRLPVRSRPDTMTVMPTPEISATEAFDEALRAGDVGDEDRRWELISHLHVHGGQKALEAATRLSDHPEPAHRILAADVLSELGAAPGQAAADGPLRERSLALLLTMLPDETDPDVLYSITIGLGPTRDERILDTLITRSAHEGAQVREWATFGLARLTDEDFPRLRDALAARLHDYNLDIRVEAVHGLATRGDQRVMQPLLDILESPLKPADPELVTEALCALATTIVDPRLRPHLLAARDRHLDDPIDEWPDDLPPALEKYGEPLPR